MSTTTINGTFAITINTVAFAAAPRQRVAVTVDDNGTVRAFDDVAGHFTSEHSITPQV